MDINPAFERIYLRQGWTPVVEEITPLTAEEASIVDEPTENETVEVPEETDEDSQVKAKVYKKGHFNTMSVDKIKELAESLGYVITAEKKAEIVDEFLAQQNQ